MTILQSLVGLYNRLERRGEAIPTPGYAPVRIGFLLKLDADGHGLALIDQRDVSHRRAIAPAVFMPEIARTSGIRPAFLWDKTAYVFGITAVEQDVDDGKRIVPGQGRRTLEEHEAFKNVHLRALADTEDEGLRALWRFLKTWSPDQWHDAAFRNDEALDENIAFWLDSDDQRIDQRAASRALIASRTGPSTTKGTCLISGHPAPLRFNHPQLKGVIGTQSSGAALVSFNADAFESYGKARGANAPVSEMAAFRYGAALNWLLDRSKARPIRLGETTVVFWADDAGVGERSAKAAEDAFWEQFGKPPAKDGKDDMPLGAASAGSRHVRSLDPRSRVDPATRLHVLGLSPNSGRVAVRFWLVERFGRLAANLERHQRDFEIAPAGKQLNQKAYALLYETAVRRKRENIPPRLGGEVARAILTGGRYPKTLLSLIITRIRADKAVNAARAGLLKAVVNRDRNEEIIPVSINRDSQDPAYNLGRLFAIYEYAEREASDRSATIRDKYIGTAAATPRRCFPILMRTHENNVSLLAHGTGRQRMARVRAGKLVTAILGRFKGETPFPIKQSIEEQGRFFVGYYHQWSALNTKPEGKGRDRDTSVGEEFVRSEEAVVEGAS